MATKKKLKHHPKHKDKRNKKKFGQSQISEEDFEKADKLLKAMVKIPPPKK
jgi:hypothetical protein